MSSLSPARAAAAAAVAALLAACPSKHRPDPNLVTREPPPADAAAPRSPYDAARAEVARLTELADHDPILAPWSGPYGGVPPWDQVTAEALPAAFTVALDLLTAEIRVITTNPEPPTFANTVAALEDIGRHRDRADTLFSVLTGSVNTPAVQEVDREWSPRLTASQDAIYFDEALFARIAAIHDGDTGDLSAEQRRLVDRTYDRFVRAGARLSADDKRALGAINQELTSLFTAFRNKVLADENTWIVIDKPADLAGLPETLRATYRAAATERGLDGKWAVVNTRSSVDPFLAASSRRGLREKVWKAFKNRGDNGDANDTNATIARIVELRAQRAKLLGFPSHAHWRMSDTMAVEPAKAEALMMRVWPAAVARVGQEVADMQKIARRERTRITIEPWDYLYYAEKVRKARYDLDQDQLKPYFELDHMISAAMWMAGELYGLGFTEITGQVPTFHADVRVWRVEDKASGALVGLFYGDYFARPGKRSGAWASTYQTHETFTGTTRIAITSNNNNFVRGAPGQPVLISLDDAETLFHEFGHALHSLLSEVNYPGLASTPRDFVEYPSQVHEMWVLTRPVLDRFGRHYQTDQAMPQKLIDKVLAAQRFNQGYGTVAYLSSAIVDMALHTLPDGKIDADAFERDTLKRIGAPREVVMRHRLPQFLHLFASDSYSAGYYSYLWSEVMDADTRQAFVEAGDVFDRDLAARMRKYILAPGNSTDRAEAYRQFRGRDPDVEALLIKRGFPTGK